MWLRGLSSASGSGVYLFITRFLRKRIVSRVPNRLLVYLWGDEKFCPSESCMLVPVPKFILMFRVPKSQGEAKQMLGAEWRLANPISQIMSQDLFHQK